MHCTWVYDNAFFIIKWSHTMYMTNLVAKLTKNILIGINFINLKIPDGYIAKSKPQGVCLQLSQTPRGDYTIRPLIYLKLIFVTLLNK